VPMARLSSMFLLLWKRQHTQDTSIGRTSFVA
jgi:hypothetical protein